MADRPRRWPRYGRAVASETADTADDTIPFARELWRRLEALHAVTYFASESLEAAEAIGVRGFWRSYFGFRAAPLGACSAGPVTAAFFGFAPAMVARAVPSIWELATPDAFLDARATAAARALRRIAGDEIETVVADGWTVEALTRAAEAGPGGGRPLYLANRDLVRPDDPVAALWQLVTTLREHRGDGHVAAWTAEGFAPIEVAVLFVAAGGTTRESLQPNRGWSDVDWTDATAQLTDRGLLAADGITEAGADAVARVESTTDSLATAPFGALAGADRQRLLDALTPPALAVTRSATIPAVNPMGVPLLGQRPTEGEGSTP